MGMLSNTTTKPKSNHKRRSVSFRETTSIYPIENISLTWRDPRRLQGYQEAAMTMARDAHLDGRYQLWSATFEEPVSEGRLCMWTTHSQGLRGLERLVSVGHGRKKTQEHQQLVRAVIQRQRIVGATPEEVAAVSRVRTEESRSLAHHIGKADQFAVSVDDMKAKRAELIKLMMVRKGTAPLPQLPTQTTTSPTAA